MYGRPIHPHNCFLWGAWAMRFVTHVKIVFSQAHGQCHLSHRWKLFSLRRMDNATWHTAGNVCRCLKNMTKTSQYFHWPKFPKCKPFKLKYSFQACRDHHRRAGSISISCQLKCCEHGSTISMRTPSTTVSNHFQPV